MVGTILGCLFIGLIGTIGVVGGAYLGVGISKLLDVLFDEWFDNER